MLSCIKFVCIDCNAERRVIVDLEKMKQEKLAVDAKRMKIEDAKENQKYAEHLQFVAQHGVHTSYNIGVNINNASQYKEVLPKIVVD